MIDGLERFARLLLVLPVAVPLLLVAGWGLGRIAGRSLDLPADAPVRITATAHTPKATLERLGRALGEIREDGARTEDYVRVYRGHVLPVERSLRRRGVGVETARRTAWPLMELAYRNGLDPATVVSIMLIESSGNPRATSFVGARGLMQIMPVHIGGWRDCGDDLYDIQDNLCIGTHYLAWLFRRFDGDERRSLLAYNGCVRGTNTPDCHRYPDRVFRLRGQIRAEWDRWSAGTPTAAAAP